MSSEAMSDASVKEVVSLFVSEEIGALSPFRK
jgi:hypothetical protein